jgi:ribosomal-protein-alanine N-acetyltransferase
MPVNLAPGADSPRDAGTRPRHRRDNRRVPLLVEPAIASGTMARNRQPDIDLGGIALRPWRQADRPGVVAAYGEPDIQRWHCRSMTDDEARGWIDSWSGRWAGETGAGWAIVDGSGLLGQISLRRLILFEGLAEVSYWVLPAARGQRVATRALTGLTGWCFDRLGLHRIEVNHSTGNPASCRVATNAGFALEGVRRHEALHADGWHDTHAHARLAQDGDRP